MNQPWLSVASQQHSSDKVSCWIDELRVSLFWGPSSSWSSLFQLGSLVASFAQETFLEFSYDERREFQFFTTLNVNAWHNSFPFDRHRRYVDFHRPSEPSPMLMLGYQRRRPFMIICRFILYFLLQRNIDYKLSSNVRWLKKPTSFTAEKINKYINTGMRRTRSCCSACVSGLVQSATRMNACVTLTYVKRIDLIKLHPLAQAFLRHLVQRFATHVISVLWPLSTCYYQ